MSNRVVGARGGPLVAGDMDQLSLSLSFHPYSFAFVAIISVVLCYTSGIIECYITVSVYCSRRTIYDFHIEIYSTLISS